MSAAILALLTVLATFALAAAVQPEVDVEIDIIRVVDGDTIVAVVKQVYNDKYNDLKGKEIRVRLADINAPEKGTPEGEEATKRLKEILAEGTAYYLDIDDIHITDKYGRIVAVLYIKTNDSLVNVNAKLVAEGYAVVWDHENEFNPETWTTTTTNIQLLTVTYSQEQNTETTLLDTITPALLVLLLFIAIAAARKALGK